MVKKLDGIIRLTHVHKKYDDDFMALKDINLTVESGKSYSLLGPSGSGKTTILRIAAGFSEPTGGQVFFAGKDITNLDTTKKKIDTVFQNYALFPHMDVFENVAFGLQIKKKNKQEVKLAVKEVLHMVQLDGFANREISELSGGQQQRVTVARAIVNQPKVLLLDESLSALDERLRKGMQFRLREIQKKLGITFILVTHDQEEALAVSDEAFVSNEGKIQQSGSPVDTYGKLVNDFVARLMGDSNILSGRMTKDYEVEPGNHRFECANAGIELGERVEVVLRPRDLDITDIKHGRLRVMVESQLPLGDHFEIKTIDSDKNEWLIHSASPTNIGKEVEVYFDPEDTHVIRFGENEAELDKRLGAYEGDE